MTVSELAAHLGGQCFSAEPARLQAVVTGVASAQEARPGDVTFLGNPKYLAHVRSSKATVALVPLDFALEIQPVALRVASPSAAFSEVVRRFAPLVPKPVLGIHPTAIIDSSVQLAADVAVGPYVVIEAGVSIGAGTTIGAGTIIGEGCQIGANCILHPRVTLYFGCALGNRVIIHSGAVLGADGFGYETKNGKHLKVPQLGSVQIDDDVEIGANSCVDRARFGRTWIGEGTKIDNLCQIGHNTQIGKHAILCGHVGVSGSSRIGDYVVLAGQVGLAGHLTIGDHVIVSAQSGVASDLEAAGTYMGTPAIDAKKWRRQTVRLHQIEEMAARIKKLEQLSDKTGEKISDTQ